MTGAAPAMVLSKSETRALRQVFALLAEGLDARELRAQIGPPLLDLLHADQFASFVWDAPARRFADGVWLHMDDANLARYDAWYQFRDPITLELQSRRHATLVSEVLPHRALRQTEFFNDFLALDGLHWGINLHAFDGPQALGDLRIWRSRHRQEFDARDKALLDLIEPAFVAALRHSHPPAPAVSLSPREQEVVAQVALGHTDKEVARALGVGVASVRTYLQRIGEKTGAHRRAAIARLAPPPR